MSRQFICCAVLLYAGAGGYYAALSKAQRASSGDVLPLAVPLKELPMKLGQWAGSELPLKEETVRTAGADAYLSRQYRNGAGQVVYLYISYYGAPYFDVPHAPDVCYVVAGWSRISTRPVELATRDGSIPAGQILFERSGERVAVQHWYVDTGRPVRTCQWSKLIYLLGSGKQPRRYVLQVQTSSPVLGTEESAFGGCEDLTAALWPELRRHLPARAGMEDRGK
jgi:EpsI family protein